MEPVQIQRLDAHCIARYREFDMELWLRRDTGEYAIIRIDPTRNDKPYWRSKEYALALWSGIRDDIKGEIND